MRLAVVVAVYACANVYRCDYFLKRCKVQVLKRYNLRVPEKLCVQRALGVAPATEYLGIVVKAPDRVAVAKPFGLLGCLMRAVVV